MLLLMQAMAWAIAGLSAIPFALAGELAMLALGLATLLFALGAAFVAIGVVWRRRWARRVALALEVVCLAGSLLLLLMPVGANRGPSRHPHQRRDAARSDRAAAEAARGAELDGVASGAQPEACCDGRRRLSATSASSVDTSLRRKFLKANRSQAVSADDPFPSPRAGTSAAIRGSRGSGARPGGRGRIPSPKPTQTACPLRAFALPRI